MDQAETQTALAWRLNAELQGEPPNLQFFKAARKEATKKGKTNG